MDITPVLSAEKQRIERYGAGAFTVAGVEYPHAVLILPDQTTRWDVRDADMLEMEDLSALWKAAVRPELLLIGTGAEQNMLPLALRTALRAEGLIVEAMDTGAACRTFNVLLAEERRIAAALLPT